MQKRTVAIQIQPRFQIFLADQKQKEENKSGTDSDRDTQTDTPPVCRTKSRTVYERPINFDFGLAKKEKSFLVADEDRAKQYSKSYLQELIDQADFYLNKYHKYDYQGYELEKYYKIRSIV